MSAADRGWGPGWPNCRRDQIVTASIGDGRLRLPVHREIVSLVAALVTELEASRGRPFRGDWSWGYACRAIAGTNTPSNHSWGLAIDLDAPENPYTTNKSATHTMPPDASAIAARWGFRWGGDYPRKKDFMHFEFMGTPSEARTLAATVTECGLPGACPPDLTVPGWATDAYDRFGTLLKGSRPNDPVTEARAVTILERVIGTGVPARLAEPGPVPPGAPGWSHRAYRALAGAIQAPTPADVLTEARAVTIVHRALRVAPVERADPPQGAPRWSHAAYRAIGRHIGSPAPNDPITEARFLVIIHRVS